jgi:uncharacterized membrane protein HdeD (DUF308 family)
MDELLGRARWMLILRGTVALLFGILALFWPGPTLLLLVTLFSAYAIVSGIVSIGAAIRYRATHGGWWVPLLLGTDRRVWVVHRRAAVRTRHHCARLAP